MKRNYRHSEPAYLSDAGSHEYMPHVGIRLKRKPGLRERLFNCFFRLEPDDNAAYEPEGGYYEATQAKAPRGDARRGDARRGNTQHAEQPRGVYNALEARQLMEIQQALSDWKAAAAYFESVTEPALVDYAVYEMEAAQKRYMYLLRSARNLRV